jgi:hypothetical protein
MTAKTGQFRASKRPLVGKYGKVMCVEFKRLLNAIKRVFLGGRESTKRQNREIGGNARDYDI